MDYKHDNPIALKIHAAVDKDIELNRTDRTVGLLGVASSEIQNVSGRLKEAHEYGVIPDDVLSTLNLLVKQVEACQGIYLTRLNAQKRQEAARVDAQVNVPKGNRERTSRPNRLEILDTPPEGCGSPLDDSTFAKLRHLEID